MREEEEEEKYEIGDEGIKEEDKVAISSKIQAIKQHRFEDDKVEEQEIENANETQRVEFWNQKKAGFVLTKTSGRVKRRRTKKCNLLPMKSSPKRSERA